MAILLGRAWGLLGHLQRSTERGEAGGGRIFQKEMDGKGWL